MFVRHTAFQQTVAGGSKSATVRVRCTSVRRSRDTVADVRGTLRARVRKIMQFVVITDHQTGVRTCYEYSTTKHCSALCVSGFVDGTMFF